MEYTYKKRFPVPVTELFTDFSSTSRMSAWMIKSDNCIASVDSDFCPGGKYHIEMKTNIGDISHYYGEYTQIETNKHIDMVWNDGEVEGTLVSFDFKEIGKNESTLILKHANLPNKTTLRHHKEFWQGIIEHLEQYVSRNKL